MAEEILNTAIPEEEAPIAESPIVESTIVEESIPDGIENLKLLHSALSGDKEYVDLVPKDFNKFIKQYSDGENATLLFQSLRGDKEYSDMIPSDPVKAASMFGVTINAKGLGKPSAVPSPSVSGGSATKGRGVEEPSTLQPKYLSPEELESGARAKAVLPSEQTISVKREEVKQKANMPSAKVIEETTPEMLAEGQQRIIKREAERALFEQKAKQGNFLGMLQNSLVESYTSTVNNTADMAMYLFSLTGIGMSPEYDAATNEEKAKMLSETLDDMGIKKTLDKQLKTESTTAEYTQKQIEEGGPLIEGVVGLAGSAFPMLTPYQTGFFINGFVDAKKEIQEAMPELSPWKQAAYAFTQGSVQMALERAGLSNLAQNKSVTRALSGKVMDAMRTTFGKFTAKEADNFATKVINGFAAEYETGATQYFVAEGLKQLTDALEGEDDKFEFEGTEQFFLNMNKAGISEGVGGGIMKTFSQLPSLIKSPLKKKEAAAVNAQTEQLAADIQNPNVSPEAKVAIDKQINDNAEDVAKAYAEDLNKYEALPEESKADLNRINEDIISHEAVLNDPNVSPETKAISEQRIQELEEQGEGILDSVPAPKPTAPVEAQPTTEAAPVVDVLKDVQSTREALTTKTLQEISDASGILFPLSDDAPQIISERYHKAKADGSNPELVNAVESVLAPQTTTAAPQTLPEVENAISNLREQEQAENEETYNKYDEVITPLLEKEKELKAEAPVAEEAKGESGVEGDVESRTNKLESKLSDFENNTRSQSTKDLIAWAEDIFDTKFEGDFNKGEYISFFNSLGDKGYEAARYLQNPKKALSILKESPVYLAKLAGQSIPTQEAQAPTSEQAPQSFPAQEGAESVEDKFQANSELEQIYRDLNAAVTKNIDKQTLDILKTNPTEAMVDKVMRELQKKGVIKIDCK